MAQSRRNLYEAASRLGHQPLHQAMVGIAIKLKHVHSPLGAQKCPPKGYGDSQRNDAQIAR
jgi:hypothetical protein